VQRIRIGTLAGIPVYIHQALVWGLVFLGFALYATPHREPSATTTLLGALLVLVSVLAHETGHALAARARGLPVVDISLHLFYGMARMKPPRTPREELIVGAAGPASNLCIAAVLYPFVAADAFRGWMPMTPLAIAFVANLVLGGVNFVPAFPMDGGRLLRAALTPSLGFIPATRVALWVGRFLAVLAILLPLYFGFARWTLPVPLVGLVVLLLGEAEWRRTALLAEQDRVASLVLSSNRTRGILPHPDGGEEGEEPSQVEATPDARCDPPASAPDGRADA
jgi:Zn-dependent protease